MDYLLFRSLKGETTAAEEEKVRDWRRSSAENEAHYRELGNILTLTADAYWPPEERLGAPPEARQLVRSTQSAGTPYRPKDGTAASFARTVRRRWWLAGGFGGGAATVTLMFTLEPMQTQP